MRFYIEHRTCPDPADFDSRFANNEGPWLSEGSNHRTWSDARGSGICRDHPRKAWVIDFNTIEDLVAFAVAAGSVAIQRASNYPFPTLDINPDRD